MRKDEASFQETAAFGGAASLLRVAETSMARVAVEPTGSPRLAAGCVPVVSYHSGRVRLAHIVLILGGWFLFGWLWSRVLQRPEAMDDVRSSASLLIVLVVVTVVVTWAWIVHNVALARRRGGRRSGAPPLNLPQRDLLGRDLVVEADVSHAALIFVTADEASKRFTVRQHVHA